VNAYSTWESTDVAYATVAVGQHLGMTDPLPSWWRAAPVGAVVRGAEVRVVSTSTGLAVKLGQLGEVCVAGPGVSLTYLGDPELTARKFVAGGWSALARIFTAEVNGGGGDGGGGGGGGGGGIDSPGSSGEGGCSSDDNDGIAAAAAVASTHNDDVVVYRTGDLGRMLPAPPHAVTGGPTVGWLEVIGRLDNSTVKLRGFKVSLPAVRAAVLAAPGVTAAVVVPIRAGAIATIPKASPAATAMGVDALAAYVVFGDHSQSEPGTSSGGGHDAVATVTAAVAAVISCLTASLPAYAVPTHVVALTALPLKAGGKLDVGALPSPTLTQVMAPTTAPTASATRVLSASGEERHGKLRPDPPPLLPSALKRSVASINVRGASAAAAAAPVSNAVRHLEDILRESFSTVLGISSDALDPEDNFFALGGHSLLAAKLVGELTDTLGLQSVSVLDLYAHPTFGSLARKVAGETDTDPHGPRTTRTSSSHGWPPGLSDGTTFTGPSPGSSLGGFGGLGGLGGLVGEEDPTGGGVAIVGISGRFPGAKDVNALWEVLTEGRSTVRRFTDEELRSTSLGERVWKHPQWVAAGYAIDDADHFDAALFGIGAKEATLMDPQQRLFLQEAWGACESAGRAPRGGLDPDDLDQNTVGLLKSSVSKAKTRRAPHVAR
jgi:acyl carrier protein